MQTDQWHNYSQSNRTIVFITKQKSLATARPFQEPILKATHFRLILSSDSSKHVQISPRKNSFFPCAK